MGGDGWGRVEGCREGERERVGGGRWEAGLGMQRRERGEREGERERERFKREEREKIFFNFLIFKNIFNSFLIQLD